MKRLLSFLVIVVVFTFFCSSCTKDKKQVFYDEHPTIESQLNFFVDKCDGDVALLARMLGEDSLYLENVRKGFDSPSSDLNEKMDSLVDKLYSREIPNSNLAWLNTRREYGDRRWSDFLQYGALYVAIAVCFVIYFLR
ncbi:MAG: hypothetical protein MJZ24_09165 [Paludibacteraceae bacterium]|nr:hypothetical protein [Paludibacteraceae bacterium]